MHSIQIVLFLLLLIPITAIGQIAKDSMPVAKPELMDTNIVVKPKTEHDNMPIVVPESIPPQPPGVPSIPEESKPKKDATSKDDIRRKIRNK